MSIEKLVTELKKDILRCEGYSVYDAGTGEEI